MNKARNFALGQQPEWAGTEAVVQVPEDFVSTLLSEDPAVSLQTRGYCVVKIDPTIRDLYSSFHTIFEKFAASPDKEKEVFANIQFDPSSHTPNQYHGFSVLCGLKEQFMMRIGGDGCSDLSVPEDLGRVGTKLYEKLDLLCRDLSRKFVSNTNHPDQTISRKILDPIHKTGIDPTYENPNVASSFLPPGYVGSSLLDNFYYYNHFKKTAPIKVNTKDGEQEYDQFLNNHASHTDSGLLTCVITTDTPGLEVVDQTLKNWIAIEEVVHEYVKRTQPDTPNAHRNYATIFWGDSLCYLVEGLKSDKTQTLPEACLHRVQQCKSERYSVVFKQRTAPLATAPRYQEDYPLAHRQLAAVDKLYGKNCDFTKGFPDILGEADKEANTEVSRFVVGSVAAASFVGLVCAAWYAYQRSSDADVSAPTEAWHEQP